MKKFLMGFLAIALLTSSLAQADQTWLGNVRVRLQHRDLDYTSAFDGKAIPYNLADYNTYRVYFDYYQQGVTEVSGTQAWQKIDAKAVLIKDSTGQVVSHGPIQIIGTDGNNVIYQIYMPAFNPQTVASLDPELQNRQTMRTHLQVLLNGIQVLSLPFDYSYSP